MIFIDRSIPKGVASALKAVRNDVRWLEDDFAHDTKDEDWLRNVGAKGWLVISRDKKIRSRLGERRALITHGVGAFCLTQRDNPTRWEILKLLVNTIDDMERTFAQVPRPFLYGVDRHGDFKRIV